MSHPPCCSAHTCPLSWPAGGAGTCACPCHRLRPLSARCAGITAPPFVPCGGTADSGDGRRHGDQLTPDVQRERVCPLLLSAARACHSVAEPDPSTPPTPHCCAALSGRSGPQPPCAGSPLKRDHLASTTVPRQGRAPHTPPQQLARRVRTGLELSGPACLRRRSNFQGPPRCSTHRSPSCSHRHGPTGTTSGESTSALCRAHAWQRLGSVLLDKQSAASGHGRRRGHRASPQHRRITPRRSDLLVPFVGRATARLPPCTRPHARSGMTTCFCRTSPHRRTSTVCISLRCGRVNSHGRTTRSTVPQSRMCGCYRTTKTCEAPRSVTARGRTPADRTRSLAQFVRIVSRRPTLRICQGSQ